MTVARRRLVYLAVIVAIMPLSGWAGTDTAWRTLFGDDVGRSLAVFFDLQVETWSGVALFAPIVDLVYGLHRDDRGWALAPRRGMARAATYGALVVLTLVCSAERPLRDVFDVGLPTDLATSVAHYFRRALEGVLTVIGLMILLDLVVLPARRRETPTTATEEPTATRAQPATAQPVRAAASSAAPLSE